MMNKKNILMYILTVVITFILVVAAMYFINLSKARKIVKNFDNAFAANEKKMIFFARKSCYYCQLQKPILKEIVKDYNLEYVDIDTDLLSEKQKKHIMDALNIDGSTPVTAIVKNKKVLNIHIGYLDGKEYVEFLKESGMLPENAIYKPEKNLTFINYNDFLSLNKGILVLGASASTTCIDIRKELNTIASEYNININYFSLSSLTKEEYYDVIDKLNSYNVNNYKIIEEDNLIFPLIYIIDGKEIKAIIEETEKEKIVKDLKKNNIIK